MESEHVSGFRTIVDAGRWLTGKGYERVHERQYRKGDHSRAEVQGEPGNIRIEIIHFRPMPVADGKG